MPYIKSPFSSKTKPQKEKKIRSLVSLLLNETDDDQHAFNDITNLIESRKLLSPSAIKKMKEDPQSFRETQLYKKLYSLWKKDT